MTLKELKEKVQHIADLSQSDEVSAHYAEDELRVKFLEECSRNKKAPDLAKKAKMLLALNDLPHERMYG